MRHYEQFIALVKGWPASDQDALLRTGKKVFRVNMTTMRRDLKAAL